MFSPVTHYDETLKINCLYIGNSGLLYSLVFSLQDIPLKSLQVAVSNNDLPVPDIQHSRAVKYRKER